ncbi:unnamed protein product, partial [Brassica rapa]
CCNFLTCFNSTLILLKTISYTDSLRTNNREMDEINSKVDWDLWYVTIPKTENL